MVCLPSLLSLPSAISPVHVERTTSVEYKLFPIVRNCDVTHQFFPPVCPGIARVYIMDFLDVSQVLEPRLVVSFKNCVLAYPSPRNLVLLCLRKLSSTWIYRIPMNCSVGVSLILNKKANKSLTNFEIAVDRDFPLGGDNRQEHSSTSCPS